MTSPSILRVLMVSNYGNFGGGAAAVFRDIGLALREKRPDLDLVAVYPWKGSLAKECARHGIRTKIALTPWWAFPERSRTPRIEALIGALPRGALLLPGILQAVLLLVRLRPTMVISNTMLIPSHAIAAKLLGIPHYWLVHEFGRDDHQLRFLLGYRRSVRLIGQLSESVICISQAVEKAMLALDPKMRTRSGLPGRRHPSSARRRSGNRASACELCLSVGSLNPRDNTLQSRPLLLPGRPVSTLSWH